MFPRIDMEMRTVHFLGRDIHFPRGYGPRRDSSCWFNPKIICSGGEENIQRRYQSLTWFLNTVFMEMIIVEDVKWNARVAFSFFFFYFSVTGVDLYSTASVFLGSVIASVLGVILIYCIRWSQVQPCYFLPQCAQSSVKRVFVYSLCLFLALLSRRRINQMRLARGPNKILLTLADVTFINPSLSNKVGLKFH